MSDEVLLSWNFHSPDFDIKGPPKIVFHILGLNLQISYQIVSLFDMYIDMGEKIAGRQDMRSLIIEDPLSMLRAPQIAQNIIFLHFDP